MLFLDFFLQLTFSFAFLARLSFGENSNAYFFSNAGHIDILCGLTFIKLFADI